MSAAPFMRNTSLRQQAYAVAAVVIPQTQLTATARTRFTRVESFSFFYENPIMIPRPNEHMIILVDEKRIVFQVFSSVPFFEHGNPLVEEFAILRIADPSRVPPELILGFLSDTHWKEGIMTHK